ncbi:MAG: hypothetical protein ABFQ65_01570 [Nanoarchaeota archaeon]
MDSNSNFCIRFTIPRDLELAEGFEVKNKTKDFELSLKILKRNTKIPGINNEKTTAYFINREDRFGDNVETVLEGGFAFNNKSFGEKWELISSEDKIKEISHLKEMLIKNVLTLLNQVIETHQYVNNKYYIFPVEPVHIYNFKLTTPFKIAFLGNQFGRGYFTNDYGILQETLSENSKKITDFINNKKKFFEPLQIMKYSIEFSKMRLLRPAITEAQSAVEHLLTLQYYKLTGKPFPKKATKKGKERDFYFFEKLEEYSKIQDKFNFKKFDRKILDKAMKMRNKIIHGKETPKLNKELCSKYVNEYKKLFDSIYFEDINN